jgi:hypothetical protein
MMLDRAKELEWRPFKEVESHEVMPSVHLIEFRSYCGRCAAIVNSSNTPVKVTYDYRLSNNYFSSRPQAVVTDVVPTRSRQILVLVGCLTSGVWCSWHKTRETRSPEAHDPAVTDTIHVPMSL